MKYDREGRPLVRLEIITRIPEKWRAVDTETGEVWRWVEGMWRKDTKQRNSVSDEKRKAFVREYGELVKKYGLVIGYDSGWCVADEVHPFDLDHPEVVEWLKDVAEGHLPDACWLLDILRKETE